MAGYAQYVGFNRIVNSTGTTYAFGVSVANNPTYYTNIQSTLVAVTATGQPKVIGGAATYLGQNRTSTSYVGTNLNNVSLAARIGYMAGSRPYRGFMNGATFALGTNYTMTGVAISGGYTMYSGGSTLALAVAVSGIAAGTIVYFGNPSIANSSGNGVASQSGANSLYGAQTVLTAGSGVVITNGPTGYATATFSPSAGPAFTMSVPTSSTTWGVTGPVNYQQPANYTAVGYTNVMPTRGFIGPRLGGGWGATGVGAMTIAGVANTVLVGGGNAGVYTRSINKRETIRTTKITTAMRNGSYNRMIGKWIGVPAVSSDGGLVGLASDTAANVNPNMTIGAPSTTVVGLPGGGTTIRLVGILTYKFALNPTNQTYKPKNGTTSWYVVNQGIPVGTETFTTYP